MEDGEGGFSFDFEGAIDNNVVLPGGTTSCGNMGGGNMSASAIVSTVAAAGLGTSSNGPGPTPGGGGTLQSGRRNYRQTVCRHWLRGLCMKGDVCGFLHQLDRSRMPVCRFFTRHGECHEPDCVYKHTYEDIKECNMYKMGFCPNGGECRYRHIKLPGPFPPLEESLQKIQVRNSASGARQYGGRHISQRQGFTGQDGTLALPSSQPLASGEDVQNLPPLPPIPPQELQHPHQEPQLPPPPPAPFPSSTQRMEQQLETGQTQVWQPIAANVPSSQVQVVSASSPLPQGFSRFFIVKSSNRENLELSVARGLWATHRNNESKLNEAFDSCDNVILIFSVNETGHFQGCARMMSKIGVIVGGGGWKYAHGTAHYGRNFRLKWLKLCELSFNKTRHLRNPYKENLPVKISRDCQELEPSVGEQLASLLYMEPDSELMKLANDTERKWEEEKTQGTTHDMEDTPFDVVEEDQEDEEESEEEDSSTPTANIASKRISTPAEIMWKKNRGRGRNLAPGGDPLFGVGYDRFPSSTNGFNKALGRGVFPTYPSLPRYGGHINMAFGPMDGGVLAPPGMLLSGRPPPNGLFVHTGTGTGMGMMGPPGSALMVGVRPGTIMAAPRPSPFIGGPGRPSGLPFRPPPAQGPGQGWVRRDQPPARMQKNENILGGGERLQSSVGDPRSMEKSVGGEVFGMSDADTRYSPKVTQLQEGDFGGESYGKDDDDSLSEDEAPRRSRHGKRRRE